MPSVTDLEMEFLGALGFTGSISDREFAYYSGLSGLPVASSLADHYKRYLELATGASGISVSDLERLFYDLDSIPAGSLSDREAQYYAYNIPATVVGGFGVQGGVAGLTMFYAGIGVPVKTNDMVIICTGSKLAATDPGIPAGFSATASGAVGTGVDGIDTGLFKIEGFHSILTTDTPADVPIAVAGGNVVIGNGIVLRKSPNGLWRAPVATIGDDTVHDLAFAALGATNLNAKFRDVIVYLGLGTANAAIQSGRTITVPGCTGTNTAINSTGTNTGNHIYIWENIFTILTGVQSGAATVNGVFAANQSGGALMVRIR